MRINKLDAKLFNKIAAGEVVERPASIVKELVENSIDAKANKITISVQGGGIENITVEDNGCGINYEDLAIAFLPHATSKIKSEEDLFGIKTLGFRGEALASIASVSEVCLKSKERDAEIGGEIEISGGQIVRPATISNCDNGTTISVSNLFFNVPARAKFLKKPKTEEGEITNLVARFILANPNLSIKYLIDGKIKYNSSGNGMKDALFEIYGKEVVNNSIYIEKDFGYIKIYGYVGKPSLSKPNKTYQTIVLNNRVIENATITGAVQNAYGELLMKKQFPLFVLYIDLDYNKVDVNVHPNKREVRFENNSDIYLKVLETVNRKINSVDFTNTIEVSKEIEKPVQEKSFEYVDVNQVVVEEPKHDSKTSSNNIISHQPSIDLVIDAKPPINNSNRNEIDYININDELELKSTEEEDRERRNIFNAMSNLHGDENALKYGVSLGSKLLNELNNKMIKSNQEEMDIAPKLEIVGTLFNTYIIIERNDDFLLVDQHAGHERILFDRFMAEVNEKNIDVQPLLVSYILNVNPLEEEYINSILDQIKTLGFDIENFGEGCYRITAVPYLLQDIDLKSFFNDLLLDVKNLKQLSLKDSLRNKLATLACKSAVKGGDFLTESEIKSLIEDFKKDNNKLLCPHGRPVVVKIERKELEKWFKRIV